ncbi:MAG TPA: MauE/DoxX family redox-associated membrane protein [Thermoanaerobaculia bacterium]|nr:MauE/DoxX family redox-associated membrane protein [Thermoanaerobaculia bacterium]
MKWALGVLFVVAGAAHFVRPDVYVRIMPPYLPWHRALVYVSGVCEVVLGVLVLVPRFTVPAAWGLIALLIAVFPANVHMAMNPRLYPAVPSALLWLRLPLQGALIAWVYSYTW